VEAEPEKNERIRRRKRLRNSIIVIALLVVAFWPVRYLASPRWEVRVENERGQPLAGMNVVLSYKNYSVENNSHEIIYQTDENGRVVFSKQIGKANAASLVLYTLEESLLFVHGSFGRHASVWANGNGLEGDDVFDHELVDWTGSPDSMRSVIVVKPVRR